LLRGSGKGAVIERIAILVDGEAALTFSHRSPLLPVFYAQAPSGSGSFLGQIIRCLVELSRADQAREDSASSSAYCDLPQGEQAAIAQALKETAGGNRQQPASAKPSIESDSARLKEAFAEAIAGRCFHFEGAVLRDDGYLGPTTRPSAKWGMEQRGATLREFYKEAIGWEESRPWQAEAQVLARIFHS
jgi:hypothetical protein